MSDCRTLLHVTHVQAENSRPALAVTLQSSEGAQLATVMLAQDARQPATLARYADFSVVKPFFRHVLRWQPARVIFDELCADTADLWRMLVAMNVPVDVKTPVTQALLGTLDETTSRWLQALVDAGSSSAAAEGHANPAGNGANPWREGSGYEQYAFSSRSHSLLILWVERVLQFFVGRGPVLDMGCGTGVFLDQLTRRGIDVRGVDENRASVRYAQLLGLSAEVSDGAEYLARHPSYFDAIHCSHLVEHLPFDELEAFMTLIAKSLRPGGRAVFVFPDPESIRSQLLGFWRDPDHVRFYHPDVIELLAASNGLDLEFNSQHQAGRTIVPFPMQPPIAPEASDALEEATSLEALVKQQAARLDQHEKWIRHLWQVNQTWAWSDDAVLVFAKPISA